jgi:hypothetical protein
MWLLGRLVPDHKTIAEFRRMHRDGVTAAGAELVRLARSVGLVKGEWVAIDGSKFQAVSSVKSVREREALERYLEQLEQSDEQEEVRGLNINHNHDLKNIFKGAATRAAATAGPLQGFYQACVARGVKPHLARLTLARKIASITLLVWKKGARFDAEHLKQQAA